MDVIVELEQYVRLQRGLVSVLTDQVQQRASSTGLPRSAEVILDGLVWSFTRHGAGGVFKQNDSGMVVDVPDEFECPEVFDLWRLRTYFGSLGRRGVKCVERATGTRGRSLEAAIEEWLSALESAGRVERVGSHYRLL